MQKECLGFPRWAAADRLLFKKRIISNVLGLGAESVALDDYAESAISISAREISLLRRTDHPDHCFVNQHLLTAALYHMVTLSPS